MNGKHILTSEEKLKYWGYGEWVEEPDVIEFEHQGFKCCVLRCIAKECDGQLSLGHLCGYVCVPKDHPKYGKDAFEEFDKVDVHGGLTYGDFQYEEYWVGFDCAHSGDITPSLEALKKKYPKSPFAQEWEEMKKRYPNCHLFNPTYKNISFVVEECKNLAEQLKEMANVKIY